MKPKKKQPVKARKMWEGAHHLGGTIIDSVKGVDGSPVFVPPATREAYDAYVEQGAKAMYERPALTPQPTWRAVGPGQRDEYRKLASRFLAANGITKPASDAGREEGK